MAKTRAVDWLATHPRILALLDKMFMPNYLLSQLLGINILPGESAQFIHPDDGFYPVPRPRAPLGAASIFALDDFTEENGATRLIPKKPSLGPTQTNQRRQSHLGGHAQRQRHILRRYILARRRRQHDGQPAHGAYRAILRTVAKTARKPDDGYPEKHSEKTRPAATISLGLFNPTALYRHGKWCASVADVGGLKFIGASLEFGQRMIWV